jgi:hypothetical protein
MAGEETSVDAACVVAQLRNYATQQFRLSECGVISECGSNAGSQILGQANLIDLFGRRLLSEAVAERFHYATQL